MSDRVTFVIPSRLWLTSNRPAQHMAARARLVRELHDLAHFAAIFQRLDPIAGPVLVTWTVRYPKGVRLDKGDASNAVPTTKALLDGLVPRWLPDDGPAHVVAESAALVDRVWKIINGDGTDIARIAAIHEAVTQ